MIDLSLKAFMAAAAVGTAGSMGALVLGLAGRGLLASWHAGLMLVRGAISLVGLFVVQFSAQRSVPRKDFRKLFFGGCPRWMRWSTVALSLAGFGLYLLLALRGHQPPEGGVPASMAGAFGLFVFPAAFAQAFSYRHFRPDLLRRCSRGHGLPFGARFCPTCGEPAEPSAGG